MAAATTLRDLYERLAGINLLRDKVHDLANDIARFADLLLDHERRLVRLETLEETRRSPRA